MKKLIVASILTTSFLLAACTAEDTEKVEETKTESQQTEETKIGDSKTALVTFHMEIIDAFKDEYQTYIAYGDAVTAYETSLAASHDGELADDAKPNPEEIVELEGKVQEAKIAAQGIAEQSSDDIRNFAIPAELEGTSEEIKSALGDLATFYDGIHENIDNVEENSTYFQSFSDKMGALFEQVELPAPNYFNAFS